MKNKPQIYSQPCPDTNRAFLCVTGHDNNLAEVFSVGTSLMFCDAHDNAAFIVRACNSHAANVARMSEALEMLQGNPSPEAIDTVRAVLSAALQSAKHER